jgi:molybdopterin converting factor small subunit
MGGERVVSASGNTIAEIAADLAKNHPALALHLHDEAGAMRRNIVFLHGDTAVRAHEAPWHAVKSGDEVVLTNALAGG